MQFKITGKPRANKFWRWLNTLAINGIKKTEDSVIDVKSVSFPSAFCVLVRYETINNSEKYEIVLQGDYQEKFKAWRENDNPTLGGLDEKNIELLIKSQHKNAKRISSTFKS